MKVDPYVHVPPPAQSALPVPTTNVVNLSITLTLDQYELSFHSFTGARGEMNKGANTQLCRMACEDWRMWVPSMLQCKGTIGIRITSAHRA